jgi:hypothetical protein
LLKINAHAARGSASIDVSGSEREEVMMRELTPPERFFLQQVSKGAADRLVISGHYDHDQWDNLVRDEYLMRQAVRGTPDTYVYLITDKGRSALLSLRYH